MDRKTFIKTSCLACTSVTLLTTLIQSCVSVKYVTGNLESNGISLDMRVFESNKKGHREYVIVRHDDLKFPICVYRTDDHNYTALLMQCTHQGVELQVSGNRLTCPAHGSEFDNKGKVMQAPAGEDLRSFQVSVVANNRLFIDLRKKAS